MARISIITVSLNIVDAIELTLRSIVSQTFQDFEWIVIDGSSTDGTIDVINKYSERINVFISEPDGGPYDAMNKGIIRATSDYLIFINGGDYIESPTTLEKIFYHKLCADIIYGNIITIDRYGHHFLMVLPSKITKSFHYRKTLPHQSTIIKRSLFKDIGLYDTSYKIAADYDFTMKALFKYKSTTQYIKETFSVFSSGGISSDSIKREKEKNIIRKKTFKYTQRILLHLYVDMKKKISNDYICLPYQNYEKNW